MNTWLMLFIMAAGMVLFVLLLAMLVVLPAKLVNAYFDYKENCAKAPAKERLDPLNLMCGETGESDEKMQGQAKADCGNETEE